MDARPTSGCGVRQVTRRALDTTIRRFPNALRALGDAFAASGCRGAALARRARARPAVYDREVDCDWTSGSFMLARREAIESAGFLDERYFMYSEETDFCRRIRTAGWEIRHLPSMTIIHHAGKAGDQAEHREPQRLHPHPVRAQALLPAPSLLYFGAMLLGASLRSVYGGSGERGQQLKAANRRKVATLLGRAPVPFGPPSRLLGSHRAPRAAIHRPA